MGAFAVDRRLLCSLAIVLGIAATQCGSTQYAKHAQVDFGDSIRSPLFLTWTGTCKNVFLALPALARSGVGGSPEALKDVMLGRSFGLGPRGFLLRIFLFYAVWQVANWSYNSALRCTSAALVSALFSANPAVVAALSVPLLGRRLPAAGWLAVACTVLGSVLVAEPWDRHKAVPGDSPGAGAAFGLLAAAAAAAYKVAFKLVFDEPSPEAVGVILAWIGVYAATVGSLAMAAVLASGAEEVHWDRVPWAPLLAGNFLSLAFNFLIGWGIAVAYPLFISMGTVLNVPANVALDYALRRELPDLAQGCGIAAIVAGFAMLLRLDLLERAAARAGGTAPADGRAAQAEDSTESTALGGARQ